MNVMSLVKTRGKKKAVAAGTAFAVANPLMTAFLVGVGAVVWMSYRRRSGNL